MVNRIHHRKIARSFGSASSSYDTSARLQRYTGKHLMPYLPDDPSLITVDLGAGTGFFTNVLASHFDTVIGVDISKNMVQYASSKRDNVSHWVAGNATALPFLDDSIDVIFSNLMIQWCQPLQPAVREILRVLKPGGVFVFSTLLDGTLYELKSSWAQVDEDKHVIDFLTENALMHAMSTPDSEIIQFHSQDIVLEYENVLHLAHELKGLGASQVPNKVSKGLAGKGKWQKMIAAYQDFLEPNDIYPATYKVFSGVLLKI